MRAIVFIMLLLAAGNATGQMTAVYSDINLDYRSGTSLADAHVHRAAFQAFDDFLSAPIQVYQYRSGLLETDARFSSVRSAIRGKHPQAEAMTLRFVRDNAQSPLASAATLELADFYFGQKRYTDALHYYQMADVNILTDESKGDILFKVGYAYFVEKDFEAANRILSRAAQYRQSQYYDDANYYLGMCRFIAGEYEKAVPQFQRVKNSERYSHYVPYYTVLLNFSLHKFETVVSDGTEAINKPDVYNRDAIAHMVGQAHFELGEYALAVPYLEQYASQQKSLRAGEIYQLAFSQYQTGQCDRAKESFKSIASLEDPIGQRANFYIADCNLISGNRREARNAFWAISRMEYDPDLQMEALFNYGKLSAELDYDKDAIETLDGIPTSSPYFEEAQNILDNIFLNTSDYASALATLSEIGALSPKLKAASQRLSFLHGVQLLNDQQHKEAYDAFENALTYPTDPSLTAQSVFWRGEISHILGNYANSIKHFNKYFTLASEVRELPFESSPELARYTQGYNYLKQQSYKSALSNFDKTIGSFNAKASNVIEDRRLAVLIDAYVRAGDCQFKLNNYAEALENYSLAIDRSPTPVVYADFQRAMILGLQGKTVDKVVVLENIATQHPDSRFADNALYQLAKTYQEMQSTDKAYPALRRLVSEHPTSELKNRALLKMGLISYNNGDLAASIEHYQSVFENNPTSTEALESLTALEEIFIHDLSSPEKYFAFTEQIPGYELSSFRKDSISYRSAEVQYEGANYASAINEFSEYLDEFPNGVNKLAALYYRGESHALLEKYDEALSDYDAVVQMGNSSFYKKSLTKAASLSYHHSESFLTALSYYETLARIAVDPDLRYDAQLGIMRSAYRSSDWEKAKIAALSIVNNERADKEERGEAHYSIGKSEFNSGDMDQAIIHFNKVAELSNTVMTAEARYLLCKIYYEREQYDIAEQLCFNANRENANYPDWVARGLILLSDVYVGKGDLFNAKAPLEALIDNYEGQDTIREEAASKLRQIEMLEQEKTRLKADSDNVLIDDQNDR